MDNEKNEPSPETTQAASGTETGDQASRKPEERKKLTKKEAVQAAGILFELNTKKDEVLEIAEKAGLDLESPGIKEIMLNEWYGFVHAAIVYALSTKASNDVMVQYLQGTHELLGKIGGYNDAAVETFVDDTFAPYLTLMVQNKQKECPKLFYERVLGVRDVTALPAERVAFLSGMMAITMCTLLDKVEQYDFTDQD